jgi:inner membrane protein
MDNLTHTLVGLALGQAGLARRFGKGTTLALIIASNLPDIDALWSFTQGRESLLMRRTFTHGVLGLPLLSLAAALIFSRFYPNLNWKTLFWLNLGAMALHVFMDLLNSYGVVLLYPFSLQRFELSWVFIIDPIIWLVLLLALLFRYLPTGAASLETMSQLSLALLALYIGMCGYGQKRSESVLQQVVKDKELHPSFTYVFPEVFGCWRFRGVIKEQDKYGMYLINLFRGSAELKYETTTDEDKPEVLAVRETKEAKKLEWFFKAPVWKIDDVAAAGGEKRKEVTVTDLRFRSLVIDRGSSHFTFRFGTT